ncbi:MAG: class II glutamine amidotransferase [Pseudomonadota bacterium]
MCRWAAYIGPKVFLEDILCTPEHSLIQQSLNASECKTATNGDGFGIAWYGGRLEPGLFRDTLPAWSDANLRSIARQVRAELFLGHVRASTGTATSRDNCHPFAVGRWSFMHNGQVGGYGQIRRDADMMIPPELYLHRRGTSDSEAFFLAALGDGLDTDPLGALERTAAAFERLARRTGERPYLRLSACLSDGERLIALRHASDTRAPTVYYRALGNGGWVVVSEPYDADLSDWTPLEAGRMLVLDGTEPQFHSFSPAPCRPAA